MGMQGLREEKADAEEGVGDASERNRSDENRGAKEEEEEEEGCMGA